MIERTQNVPTEWDDEFDVVVVGSGGGGLTGALVAAIEGASAIVLEKTELLGGTTSVSGGGVWIPMNRHMEEVGVSDSRDEALDYLRACGGIAADEEIIVALVDNGYKMVEYVEDRGGMLFRSWPGTGNSIDYRPELPGAKHGGRPLDAGKFRLADLGDMAPKLRTGVQSAWLMDRLEWYRDRRHTWAPEAEQPRRILEDGEGLGEYLASGSALAGQLLKACAAQGVSIVTESPVDELVVDDGAVVGVATRRDGEPFYIRARVGVLLATGGYGHNAELIRLWMERPLEWTCEAEGNVGDGHLMAAAIGAQLAGLGDAWWMMLGASHSERYVPHTVIVNRHARRFCNESVNYYDFGHVFGSNRDTPTGPRHLPAWFIFDSQGASKYSVLADKVKAARASATVVEAGGSAVSRLMTSHEASSLDELAGLISVDAGELRKTIDQFNEYAREGYDPDFHRGESRWTNDAWGDLDHKPNPALGTIEEGPFFAFEIRTGALATRGGVHVNARAEVLSAAGGKPIPGLYAAGNVSDGAVPFAYPGPGSTLGAAMTFGYIAGLELARTLSADAVANTVGSAD